MTSSYTLKSEQWIPVPLDRVFAFFSNAENLETLTPEWLRFQILTPLPIVLAEGALIDYRLRWHHISLRWRTEITLWEPPHRFEDMQLKGPYRLWHHTHTFQAVNGGTRIGDHVIYALPFGIVGRAVHVFSVRRNVEQIFTYRQQKVRALFGDHDNAPSPQA